MSENGFMFMSIIFESLGNTLPEVRSFFLDIGGFNAHQKEFKRLEAFTNNKQRMMELVYKAWDKISWEVMDNSWACFFNFNNLRSIIYHAVQG